jgi:hypothetical protein
MQLQAPAFLAAMILALGLLFFLPAAAVAAAANELLPPGETAPAFTAVTMEGKPFVLEEELAGGPIFLVFWSIF